MLARPAWPALVLLVSLGVCGLPQKQGHLWERTYTCGDGALALSPDGKTVGLCEDRWIRLVDASTGKSKGKLPSTPSYRLDFSRDGSRLTAWGFDGLVQYAYPSGKVLLEIRHKLREAAVTADGRRVLAAPWLEEWGKYSLDLYEEGRLIWSQHGQGKNICANGSLFLAPEGDRFMVRCSEGPRFSWSLVSLHRAETALPDGRCAFSPDGTYLALCSRGDPRRGSADLTLRDGHTGARLREVSAPNSLVVAFSPDGRSLVVSGHVRTQGVAQTYAVPDLSQRARLELDTNLVSKFLDDRAVVTYDVEGGRWTLWDSATGKLLRKPDDPIGQGYVGALATHRSGLVILGGECLNMRSGDLRGRVRAFRVR